MVGKRVGRMKGGGGPPDKNLSKKSCGGLENFDFKEGLHYGVG